MHDNYGSAWKRAWWEAGSREQLKAAAENNSWPRVGLLHGRALFFSWQITKTGGNAGRQQHLSVICLNFKALTLELVGTTADPQWWSAAPRSSSFHKLSTQRWKCNKDKQTWRFSIDQADLVQTLTLNSCWVRKEDLSREIPLQIICELNSQFWSLVERGKTSIENLGNLDSQFLKDWDFAEDGSVIGAVWGCSCWEGERRWGVQVPEIFFS